MRRGTLIAALILVALNVGDQQALAQTSSAQRPILKVGDTWTYAVRYTGQQTTPASQTTIAVVNADGGQVTSTWQDTVFGNGTVQFDSNLNLVQRVRAPTFIDFRATPSRPNYQWPLYPGATWQGSFQYTAYNGGRQYQATLKG